MPESVHHLFKLSFQVETAHPGLSTSGSIARSKEQQWKNASSGLMATRGLGDADGLWVGIVQLTLRALA